MHRAKSSDLKTGGVKGSRYRPFSCSYVRVRHHTALLASSVGGRTIGQDTWKQTTTAAVGVHNNGTTEMSSSRVPECYWIPKGTYALGRAPHSATVVRSRRNTLDFLGSAVATRPPLVSAPWLSLLHGCLRCCPLRWLLPCSRVGIVRLLLFFCRLVCSARVSLRCFPLAFCSVSVCAVLSPSPRYPIGCWPLRSPVPLVSLSGGKALHRCRLSKHNDKECPGRK